MAVHEKHKDMLVDNRLRRIENRLRRIEILFLKTLSNDKKINKELGILEKEERIIEKEQKNLESEEKKILKEMKFIEAEEKWNIEIRYNCKSKVMENNNLIKCAKTSQACELSKCPLAKK